MNHRSANFNFNFNFSFFRSPHKTKNKKTEGVFSKIGQSSDSRVKRCNSSQVRIWLFELITSDEGYHDDPSNQFIDIGNSGFAIGQKFIICSIVCWLMVIGPGGKAPEAVQEHQRNDIRNLLIDTIIYCTQQCPGLLVPFIGMSLAVEQRNLLDECKYWITKDIYTIKDSDTPTYFDSRRREKYDPLVECHLNLSTATFQLLWREDKLDYKCYFQLLDKAFEIWSVLPLIFPPGREIEDDANPTIYAADDLTHNLYASNNSTIESSCDPDMVWEAIKESAYVSAADLDKALNHSTISVEFESGKTMVTTFKQALHLFPFLRPFKDTKKKTPGFCLKTKSKLKDFVYQRTFSCHCDEHGNDDNKRHTSNTGNGGSNKSDDNPAKVHNWEENGNDVYEDEEEPVSGQKRSRPPPPRKLMPARLKLQL
ncbi:unnamed protein product [Ambrosiozyma monospora]|uniref:Unnamed protein product n=1 Tax=Ambrosiozyma monospora TaxID=43982 RepID=A0ACB5T264_AMBMO|nr:unnamed protein product [Ambrosiozyma monospora]